MVKKILFLTIQISTRNLFAFSLNVKQFYLTHREDPIWCYCSGSEWTWEQWQWKSTPHPPKLYHQDTRLEEGGHTHLQRCSPCILQLHPTGLGCPEYYTKLHPMMRFQFWISGECGEPFYCFHHSPRQLSTRVVVPVRIPF